VAAPVGNLLTAVQALQATLAGLGDQPSLGAKLAAVKLAIGQITAAAADVETALGTTCPAQ
jgi:predicted trehalose synthase